MIDQPSSVTEPELSIQQRFGDCNPKPKSSVSVKEIFAELG
jgi:hypothetical protein